MELCQQMFQLISLEVGAQQAHEFQRVEAPRASALPIDLGQITAQVVVHDAVIVLGVVAHQGHLPVAHEVEKHAEGVGMGMDLMVSALLDDGIGNVAQHGGNGAIGLNIHGELGHAPALPYLFGGNLHDVVLKDVESGGLGVEHHDVVSLIKAEEFLQVSVVVGAKKIGWADGEIPHFAKPATRRGLALADTQAS